MSGDCDMCGQPIEVCDVCLEGDQFARVTDPALDSGPRMDGTGDALREHAAWRYHEVAHTCGLEE